MARPKLPIGIQTFAVIRTEGYCYADKTAFLDRLAASGKYFFLSRPRRFGKSLFVDTLDCAFSGRRELFEGLFLTGPESQWDWSLKHPVLRFSLGTRSNRTVDELREHLNRQIDEAAERHGQPAPAGTSPSFRIADLVRLLHRVTGAQAVVLVDEYDKPILDNIGEPAVAAVLRDELKSFYSVFKDLDPHLRLLFLTGVSKFTKTGIFSGLNNLRDLTLDARYSALCGYREGDLDEVFADWLEGHDRAGVQAWYNGYSWGGEAVYNPFDILLFLESGEFRSYWFETGTPAFLVEIWKRRPRQPAEYDGLIAGEELLGSFDIENLSMETLLFQAGYLTVKDVVSNAEEGTRYRLGFPNREVRESCARLFLGVVGGDVPPDEGRLVRLRTALKDGDSDGLRAVFDALLASIPHDWHRNNPVARYEGYWASVVYCFLASLGYETLPEDTTSRGRIDLTLILPACIWIFEFKVAGLDRGGNPSPLAQLVEKNYAAKYAAAGKPVRLVGILFDPETREISGWETG